MSAAVTVRARQPLCYAAAKRLTGANGARNATPRHGVPALTSTAIFRFKDEMSVLNMMTALKLGGRHNFLEKYLTPAIELGLVEMAQPNSPRSPTQKYRLTPKGLAAKESCR